MYIEGQNESENSQMSGVRSDVCVSGLNGSAVSAQCVGAPDLSAVPLSELTLELAAQPFAALALRADGNRARVVLGMSGGVDSSVSALILKAAGFEVIGMFMKNWDEKDDSGECTTAQDYADVKRVCDELGIAYYGIEFVQEYWDHVFARFLEEYRAGFTPNPDILCNREIKFNLFYDHAKKLGADYLATGHYCRKMGVGTGGADGGEAVLLKGVDQAAFQNKDQTYFVYTLQESVLRDVLFPVGHLTKAQVRELARRHAVPTAAKKDSTGICFIGERKFRDFLGGYVAAKPGAFKLMDGTRVGTHRGVAFYTLGQRRGLGLGGEGARWYVVAKDVVTNTVYVERGDDHPALYARDLWARELSFVGGERALAQIPFEGAEGQENLTGAGVKLWAKIRYRMEDVACWVTRTQSADGETLLHVRFEQPQRAITPGQSIVFYANVASYIHRNEVAPAHTSAPFLRHDLCLGGAVICKVGPTLHDLLPASS